MSLRYELRMLEVLGEVRDEMRAVRRLLEEAHRPVAGEARYAALVQVIAATAGERLFTSAELIAHCALPEAEALREAITGALGRLNTKALGKLLRRIEGQDFGGFSIVRIGAESSGVVWGVRVSGVRNPQTRAAFA